VSQNYIRSCHVTFAYIGKTYTCDMNAIRVRFGIKKESMPQPNIATIRLTNQNRDLAKRLTEGSGVIISAGYLDNEGVIFQGELRFAMYGRENPTDTMTTVIAADGGQAKTYATVSKTLPPGSTPKDIVDTAISSLSNFGVTLGFVGQGVNLSTPVYPRSIALMGMAYKLLEDVAKSKGATVSTQDTQVHMATPDDVLPGEAFILNSGTGLIGMPTLTIGGVYARSLINPRLKVNGLVHIDQSLIQGLIPELGPGGTIAPGSMPGSLTYPNLAADGIYKVFKIDVDADTRGNPWYQDIMCTIPGQESSASIYSRGQAQ
jgi:hypothetical protein